MSTDHTSGTAPFDFGTFAAPNQNAAPITAATEFDHTFSGVASPAPPLVGAAAVEAIEFRVLRAGSPVRRLRLTGNRYTFGNAEGCSIRLNDHALRPMHAVMIRDAQRIMVRAYSVPIEVNSIRTTEATLSAGDVMRLGEYRFELLPSTSHTDVSGYGSGTGQPQAQNSPRATSRPQSIDDDIVWRERLRREVDQWRARQVECDRRETRCDDREADLRGRESELWTRADQMRRRESQLKSQESAALQIQHEYANKQEELVRIREENRARQQDFDRREKEYREQAAEASRQLQQSQQQAAAANEAVQRMREQFSSLNKQLEELSGQQQQLENHERHQREEHQRLRQDLERARDEAIDARAESEARRQEAEARVEQLSERLEHANSTDDGERESQRHRLAESEEFARQLQQQVEELQKSVQQAGEESAQLRHDYEDACETVRQLESTIGQSNQRSEQDRESWLVEADQLRQSVEQLSVDLAHANSELSDLREANQSLSDRLDESQRERDDAQRQRDEAHAQAEAARIQAEDAHAKVEDARTQAEDALAQANDARTQAEDALRQADGARSEAEQARADAEARPTSEAWQSLQQELDAAKDHLNEIQQEYEGTLVRLEEATAAADQAAVDASAHEHDSDEPAAVAKDSFNAYEGDESVLAEQQHESSQEADDEAWPTYEAQPTEPDAESVDSVQPQATVEADDDTSQSYDAASELHDPIEATSEVDVAEHDVADHDAADHDAADHEDTPESSESDWSSEPQAPTDEVESNTAEHTAVWSDAANEASDAVVEESPWQSADESPTSDDSVEMTNPWDNIDESFAGASSDDADVQEDNPWSMTENESDQDAGEADPVEGSLASMLIKDIQSDVDSVSDDPPGDTYAMNEDAPALGVSTEAWGEASASDAEVDSSGQRWDQEHLEESLATSWSNDDEGYRNESVAEDESVGDYSLSADMQTSDDEGSVNHWSPEQESETYVASTEAAIDEPEVTATDPPADDASPADGDVDDDSIEAYMNRLLQRVQGDDAPPPGNATSTTTSLPVRSSATETTAVTEVGQLTEINDETANATEVEETIDPNAPLVPRSLAPEKNSNLTAMRELANESARSAINRSVKIQTRDTQIKAMGKFVQAGIALVCAALIYVFIVTALKYIAIAAIFVIGGFCVQEGLQLLSDAKRRLEQAEADMLRGSRPATAEQAPQEAAGEEAVEPDEAAAGTVE